MPIAYVTSIGEGKSSNTLTAIKNYVDTKASPYKKLRGESEEIPKTGSSRILRRLLPARMARERQAKL